MRQSATLCTGLMIMAGIPVGTASAIPMTDFQAVLPSAGAVMDDSSLAGNVTNQMFVMPTAGADWTASEIIILLDAGTVYNASGVAATDSSPNTSLFSVQPFRNSQFDTFVTGGGFDPAFVNGKSGLLPSSFPPGSPGVQTPSFTGPRVDIAWGDIPANDTSRVLVGQFTLSADAIGRFEFASQETGAVTEFGGGSIVGGTLLVPEPTSLGLLGFGGLALLRRRRA